MKKRILGSRVFYAVAIAALALFTAGCSDSGPGPHIDPAFLVGTWTNPRRNTQFTIDAGLSFVCELDVPNNENDYSWNEGGSYPRAQLKGTLDPAGLGGNDYIIRGLTRDGSVSEYNGNTNELEDQLRIRFKDLHIILTPQDNGTKFVFTSTNPAANLFFNGTYTKQ